MAIYRGEGGSTDVEAAPGDTEFAGSIIVERDAYIKGDLTVDGEIYGDGSKLTGIANLANTYTKGEVDASQAAQDVKIDENTGDIEQAEIDIGENSTKIEMNTLNISNKVSNAPIDGSFYAMKNAEWETLPTGENVYTKPEIDAQQDAQDVKIDANTDAISNLPTPVDTYTKTEIDAQQNAQDTKITVNNDDIARQQNEITNNTSEISKNATDINTNTAGLATTNMMVASNTNSIGTLSGQVAQNSEDIAELQDGIFFTSAYSADYPSNPNRDPEDGNMYLQNLALFTYSYANATQIFVSKTDESGNVRQFTAVQPGDSVVLNQVDSPNYGRYELVGVEDVNDSYVVMNVNPMMGQGTVIAGVKVAFQAFPKPGSGGGDSIWSVNASGYATYTNNIEVNGIDVGTSANSKQSNAILGRNATGQNAAASGYNNVAIGDNAFGKMGAAYNSVGVGYQALKNNIAGSSNTAVGAQSLFASVDQENTGIGAFAGSTLASGSNNTFIGNNAQPSADGVSNEVTIGNDNVAVTRLKGQVQTTADMFVNGMKVGQGGGATAQPESTVLGVDVLAANVSGSANTGLGSNALRRNTSGYSNTAVGRNALTQVVGGANNTAVGSFALGATTGNGNTSIGESAGSAALTGNNNLMLGSGAQPSSATANNEVTIGNGDVTTVRMGNGDLIYPMSSPVLYTAILGTTCVLPNDAVVGLEFVGTGWSGTSFTVPKTGIYFLDASYQWSLINPISNQLYRNALIGINGGPSVYQTSMGIETQYPYGSINEFTWLAELNEGDTVTLSAQQNNTNAEQQEIPTGFNNMVYANFAYLGKGSASTYVANKMISSLSSKLDKLEQQFKSLST